jgi:hypothetical protein
MKRNIVMIGGRAGSGKDTVGKYLQDRYGAVPLGQADPLKRFLVQLMGFSNDQLWGPSHLRNQRDSSFDNITPERMEAVLDSLDNRFWDGTAGEAVRSWRLDDSYDDHVATIDSLYDNWFRPVVLSRVANYQGITPRLLLQTLGTDWGRNTISQDMWIDYAVRLADLLLWGGFDYQRESGLVSRPGARAPFVIIPDLRFLNEFEKVSNAGGICIKIERDVNRSEVASAGIQNHQSEEEIDQIPRGEFDYIIENNGTLEDLYSIVDHIAAENMTPQK